MSKILSQEEIDALLSTASAVGQTAGAVAPPPADGLVAYNFRRPDRVTKEQLRALQFLHDRFARNVATSLSAYLRAVTDVSVAAVEQFTYAEFLASLPDPTAFYAFSMSPLDGHAALELSPNVAFTMVDRMLGGTGRGVVMARGLTEIEQNVIDGVVKLILENLTEAWRGIVDVRFRISGRETRPQMLQVAAPNEVVVLLGFELRLGEARGALNVCVPASAIEAIRAGFPQAWQRSRTAPSDGDRRTLMAGLAKVRLPLTATLTTTVPARDLLALKRGDVVSLGHPVRSALDVRVRGTLKFRGRLVAHNDGAAVRLEPAAAAPASEAQ
jgi:flagellar motor switch protein FliM